MDNPQEREKVQVALIGEDGNIFSIMGRVTKAMRRAGWSQEAISEFVTRLTDAENYDAALRVVLEYAEEADD